MGHELAECKTRRKLLTRIDPEGPKELKEKLMKMLGPKVTPTLGASNPFDPGSREGGGGRSPGSRSHTPEQGRSPDYDGVWGTTTEGRWDRKEYEGKALAGILGGRDRGDGGGVLGGGRGEEVSSPRITDGTEGMDRGVEMQMGRTAKDTILGGLGNYREEANLIPVPIEQVASWARMNQAHGAMKGPTSRKSLARNEEVARLESLTGSGSEEPVSTSCVESPNKRKSLNQANSAAKRVALTERKGGVDGERGFSGEGAMEVLVTVAGVSPSPASQ